MLSLDTTYVPSALSEPLFTYTLIELGPTCEGSIGSLTVIVTVASSGTFVEPFAGFTLTTSGPVVSEIDEADVVNDPENGVMTFPAASRPPLTAIVYVVDGASVPDNVSLIVFRSASSVTVPAAPGVSWSVALSIDV